MSNDQHKFSETPEEEARLFNQERLLVEVAVLINRAMMEEKVNRKTLAERLGVSKSRVTRILGGEWNLKLRSLADIFTALNRRPCMTMEDLSAHTEKAHLIASIPASAWKPAKKETMWKMCLKDDLELADSLAA